MFCILQQTLLPHIGWVDMCVGNVRRWNVDGERNLGNKVYSECWMSQSVVMSSWVPRCESHHPQGLESCLCESPCSVQSGCSITSNGEFLVRDRVLCPLQWTCMMMNAHIDPDVSFPWRSNRTGRFPAGDSISLRKI